MKKKKSNNQFEIEILSKNYIESKRKLKEHDSNLASYSTNRIRAYKRIVTHIEDVAKLLPEKERIIIENEVIHGKKGSWYLEFFSASSYYRHRNAAYSDFLNCL